ncbi:MAG: glycosyl hydrolase [Alteromonadaceae bacterium]|nr:glycosyl hydrolase [Alteromonadaceae bacterium]
MDKVTSQLEQPMQRTDFYQAFASNEEIAVLVGTNGVVLTSRDTTTWNRHVLPEKPSLLAIDTCPDQTFIALSFDNHIWVSSPNGNDWSSVQIDTQEQLMTIDCAPNGEWWAAGGFSTFLRSNDRGLTWQSNTLEEDAIITNLVFLSEQEAVATAEFGMLLVTNDGGNSWTISGFMPDEFYPHAAFFTSTSQGWVGGLNGFIYYTNDSGNTWQRQNADSAAPIYQIENVNGELFALGDNATVLKLTGNHWITIQPATAPVYLRAALSFNNNLLVAGGRGMLMKIDPSVKAVKALPANETEKENDI